MCFAVIRAKVVGHKEVGSGNDIYGNPIKRVEYEIKQIKVRAAAAGGSLSRAELREGRARLGPQRPATTRKCPPVSRCSGSLDTVQPSVEQTVRASGPGQPDLP